MEAVREKGGISTDLTRPAGVVRQGYTGFADGDVVVAKITPCFENGKGSIVHGMVGGVGFGTTELHVLRSTRADPRWLFYVTQSHSFMSHGEGSMYGAGGQKRVPPDFIRNYKVVTPPVSAQRAIADFLDRKTSAIDAVTRKKERQIELLQEKRQALITQAVTKGLDPNVRMKDSGVPWLGQIPAHWETSRLKRLARPGYKTFTDGDWIEAPFITDSGVRLIQTGNVGVGVYREQGSRYVSLATFESLRCTRVEPNDVLICRLDGPVGRACVAPDLGLPMITSVDNAILKPSGDTDSRFLVYALSVPGYLDWVQSLCRVGGGHRVRISRSMLGEFLIPRPPEKEQRQLADTLDRRARESVSLERKVSTQLAALFEYRQALISTAVTGQIEVTSEAAA